MENNDFFDMNTKFYDHIGLVEGSNLHGKKVAIILSENLKDNENAQNTFLLSINLLVRLFTKICMVIPPGTKCKSAIDNGRCLNDLALEIAKSIYGGDFKTFDTSNAISDCDGQLIVGYGIPADKKTVFCSSNGWNVFLNQIDGESANINPIGACAAACFGSAEVFKLIANATGMKLNNSLKFSLLNYDTCLPAVNPPIDIIDLKNVTLVGAGAIGSGFIYTLNLFHEISGNLDVVDGDYYTSENLHRYILSNKFVVGKFKAEHAHDYLNGHKRFHVTPYKEIYKQYVNDHKKINTIICVVDKPETRRNMQGDLHRMIIDGATSDSCIDIARVEFGKGNACLGCIYPPEKNEEVKFVTMAENLGLPVEKVKHYYLTNEGVSKEDIEIVSKKIGDKSEFIGQPIDSLYSHGYCGGSVFKINESLEEIVAPISFISALAGVFVASELIKDRILPDFTVRNHFYIDTFKTPNPYFQKIRVSDKNCNYCSNELYIDAFKEKWG